MPELRQSIAAVVLAAGGSTRMGKPKQLLPYHGRTLIEHAVQVAIDSRCGKVYVIAGAAAEQLASIICPARAQLLENVNWREGISSSIRTGLKAAIAANENLQAVLITLADQPLVTAEALVRLLETFDSTRALAIASEYSGSPGVPAIFSRELFSELLSLRGAEGAKKVLLQHQNQIVRLPLPEAALDVDLPEDYEALLRTARFTAATH